MKCRSIKHLLPLFLDGQLNARKALKLKIHLDGCPSCSQELNLLKETWDLLGKWEPVHPSPNFKANFWQRVAQEETSLERQPVFILPRLKPQLVPVFATLLVIFIISISLVNFLSVSHIQHMAILTKNEDIQMLKELDLAEDFEIIQNITILEDFDIINSIELS